MRNSRRLVCFIVAVLGFTFFPGLAESKGAITMQQLISYGIDVQQPSGLS